MQTVCLVLANAARESMIFCQEGEIVLLVPLERLCLLTEGMNLGYSIGQTERNPSNTRYCSMASDPQTP